MPGHGRGSPCRGGAQGTPSGNGRAAPGPSGPDAPAAHARHGRSDRRPRLRDARLTGPDRRRADRAHRHPGPAAGPGGTRQGMHHPRVRRGRRGVPGPSRHRVVGGRVNGSGQLVLVCWAHHRQVDLRMWTIHPADPLAPQPEPDPGSPTGDDVAGEQRGAVDRPRNPAHTMADVTEPGEECARCGNLGPPCAFPSRSSCRSPPTSRRSRAPCATTRWSWSPGRPARARRRSCPRSPWPRAGDAPG